MHKRCDVILEARIAIGTISNLLAIHIDRRVHIHPVELDKELCVLHRCLAIAKGKRLPIPTNTSRQGSPTRTARIADIEVAFYRPVVGYVELSPPGVVIVHLRHLHGVAKHEPPVLVETLTFPRLCCHTCQHDGHYQQQASFHFTSRHRQHQ